MYQAQAKLWILLIHQVFPGLIDKEEYSSNLKEKNAFTNHDRACFFVIKGNDGDFFEKSPKTQSHSIYYWWVKEHTKFMIGRTICRTSRQLTYFLL